MLSYIALALIDELTKHHKICECTVHNLQLKPLLRSALKELKYVEKIRQTCLKISRVHEMLPKHWRETGCCKMLRTAGSIRFT